MKTLLTPTQVGSLMNVSEKTVARMANDGRLPKPHLVGGKPRYSEGDIERLLGIEDGRSVGFTLGTRSGSVYLEVVEAKYMVVDLGQRYAVFELKDGSLHLRPWISYVVADLPDHEPVFLSCEDTDTPEMGLCDLPSLVSAVRTPR
ncbi:helix-turn-helix domain-containing protein [Mesorhizobium sp. B2-4-8]|uniref:helix-turn-helix transcriptional regulator n=1 Tax=Mesorhizobium sp. B2-4-8 TaxID=2589941 RepID=UPI00112A3087|nr:helix-turn-helix domain-containing protein [Mesorhizobium sp. B2-4-8]TPL29524.1 helix-turn-helix domain-containing protein [Mesorhizobium sp. B2-4-8]